MLDAENIALEIQKKVLKDKNFSVVFPNIRRAFALKQSATHKNLEKGIHALGNILDRSEAEGNYGLFGLSIVFPSRTVTKNCIPYYRGMKLLILSSVDRPTKIVPYTQFLRLKHDGIAPAIRFCGQPHFLYGSEHSSGYNLGAKAILCSTIFDEISPSLSHGYNIFNNDGQNRPRINTYVPTCLVGKNNSFLIGERQLLDYRYTERTSLRYISPVGTLRLLSEDGSLLRGLNDIGSGSSFRGFLQKHFNLEWDGPEDFPDFRKESGLCKRITKRILQSMDLKGTLEMQ